MNQILSTEMNRNKNKRTNSTVIDIKKIIIFFAIILIIFGVVLVVNGVFTTVSNMPNENTQAEQTIPEVEMEQGDDEIILTINHDKPITKITYNWNEGQEITINGNNRTSIKQTITLPDGTNKLTIKITDEIQSVATIEKSFTKIEGEIDLSFALVENKIKITAEDTNQMAYLTYKWNSEEETRVDIEETAQDKKMIEVEIEIPEGLNTLTVIATNKDGKVKTKKQDIEGIAAPKVTVQKDGEYLIINVQDENVVTLLNYTLNNQQYRINLTVHDADYYNAIEGLAVKTNQNNEIIEVEYRQLMTEKGENILTLTAENKKDAKSTYSGKCNNE